MLQAIPFRFFFVVPSFGQMWKSEFNFRNQSVYMIVHAIFIIIINNKQYLLCFLALFVWILLE
jgi:diacylglycerol kinase